MVGFADFQISLRVSGWGESGNFSRVFFSKEMNDFDHHMNDFHIWVEYEFGRVSPLRKLFHVGKN